MGRRICDCLIPKTSMLQCGVVAKEVGFDLVILMAKHLDRLCFWKQLTPIILLDTWQNGKEACQGFGKGIPSCRVGLRCLYISLELP